MEKRGQGEKKGKAGCLFVCLSSGSSLGRGKAGHEIQRNIQKWMHPVEYLPHGNDKD